MSRTYHHSRKWGPKSRYVDDSTTNIYRCGMFGSNRHVSESPNWFSHMRNIVPARRQDMLLLKKLKVDPDLWDNSVMPFTGTRRPHKYWW